MIDDDLTNKFFLESESEQLRKIYLWARARYAAPWAVFFAVLLRVAASVGPNVRLPGVIGGQASLNLLVAFVSQSGGGKGISDKVGRLAWPTEILELPIGSGEGIAETFTLRGKESDDNERVTEAIFSCSEIDILTGLESRQGSTILGTLKAFAMGEQLGATNASKATSRNVPAHSYRGCLSVGAQPGHTGVIFNDTTGGTPQRLLWALTTDAAMPATVTPDPEPLDTTMPAWKPGSDSVVEIVYGHDEITATIISSHLARQRGEADALDGHAMLTRCKVAAVLAIMHQRSVVSEHDWRLSEIVMSVSNSTRDWIVTEAKRAARAKVRDRATARAAGEDFYDDSRLETVKRSILRMLERDGEQAGNVLRSRLGRKEKRELFDQAVALLEADGLVSPAPGLQKGARYRIGGQGDHDGQGAYQQVTRPDRVGQGDRPATVTDLDTRRSHDPDTSKLSCPKWLAEHVAELQSAGHTATDSLAVHAAGKAAGHSVASISNAVTANPVINETGRKGLQIIYDITGKTTEYTPLPAWVHSYLDGLIREGIDVVDKDAFKTAAEAAEYNWESAARSLRSNGRIQIEPATGADTRKTIWRIVETTDRTSADDGRTA